MEEKVNAYTWYIPSMHELLNSDVDEVRITIGSQFKVKLDLTKNDNGQVHLYVLPLVNISEFKFTLCVWINENTGGHDYQIRNNRSSRTSIVQSREETVKSFIPGKWIHCRKIKFVEHLLDCDCKAGLNIKLDFRYSHNKPLTITKRPIISNSLQNDLEELFTSGKFHDAVIKTSAGNEFKVHKVILATRCEVLNAAFQHETTEAVTNIVQTPFDEETMENLLLFLYSHKTPNIDTIAEKLLVAADYYQLNELKNRCAEILIEKLSGENVVELLGLAMRHTCTILQEGVLNFINQKNIPAIVQSEGWLKSSNVKCEMCAVLKLISERFAAISVNSKQLCL